MDGLRRGTLTQSVSSRLEAPQGGCLVFLDSSITSTEDRPLDRSSRACLAARSQWGLNHQFLKLREGTMQLVEGTMQLVDGQIVWGSQRACMNGQRAVKQVVMAGQIIRANSQGALRGGKKTIRVDPRQASATTLLRPQGSGCLMGSGCSLDPQATLRQTPV